MKIQDVLAWRRKQLNLTLEEVAKHVDVGKSTVRKWEKGMIKNMGRDKIALLAEVLGLPAALLLKDEVSIDEINSSTSIPTSKQYSPFIKKPANEHPIYADSYIEAYASEDTITGADFTVQVHDDSMAGANINDGDIVFIHKQDTVDDGEIAAVQIEDNTVLKRIYHIEEKIQFMSENPKYKPIYFDKYCDTFKILGKAVALYSKVE